MTEEETISLAIVAWKLAATNERFIADLPISKQRSAEAKSRNLRNSLHSHVVNLLQKNGIELNVFEGKPYNSEYPIKATNADDFANGEKLVVRETLEPALVKNGKVLHFAKVVLTREENFDKQPENENVSGN